MNTTTRARGWATRAARWVAPIYATILMTIAVDVSAQPFGTDTTANAERARIRKLGNIIGLSLMGALLLVPVIAAIRYHRNGRNAAVEDAE